MCVTHGTRNHFQLHNFLCEIANMSCDRTVRKLTKQDVYDTFQSGNSSAMYFSFELHVQNVGEQFRQLDNVAL